MPSPFSPPTPEQVEHWIADHPLQPPSSWAAVLPLLVLGGALVLVLILPPPLSWILPWLALGAVIVMAHTRGRRGRQLERRATNLHELAMLRHFAPALRRAWDLLPEVTTHPGMHSRIIAVVGHCLDQLRCYESAIAAYDHLARVLPDDHPANLQAQVDRAMAQLAADHLSDADDALRRLRPRVERAEAPGLMAGFTLAQLAQHVSTNHFADGIHLGEKLTETLRPLGVDAGYGHALLALCHHHTGSDEAGEAWRRATTLLPARQLVYRFPQLAVLQDRP